MYGQRTDREGRPSGLLLNHFRMQIPAFGYECARMRVDLFLCEGNVSTVSQEPVQAFVVFVGFLLLRPITY